MKNKLLDTIQDWVNENKKIFWKYEVSTFYQTYKISVANLPKPSKEDIKIVSHSQLLNNAQKTQLCGIIKKACAESGILNNSSVNVKIDYVKGAVIAAAF